MGRMRVTGHRNFGRKELEECGIKWGRMAGNFEEGQGPQRAVAPMMTMMMISATGYKCTLQPGTDRHKRPHRRNTQYTVKKNNKITVTCSRKQMRTN
jgi:hypothetical protein